MLKQKVRLDGTEVELEWKQKTTPDIIGKNMGAETGIYSGMISSDILNKLYTKSEIHNIFNGSFPGNIPLKIDLMVGDSVVGSSTWWLTTYQE